MQWLFLLIASTGIGLYLGKRILDRVDAKTKKRVIRGINRVFEGFEDRGTIAKIPGFDRDYHDTYPELLILEASYKSIRDECEILLASNRPMTSMSELGGKFTKGATHTVDWTTFMFKSGNFIEANCRLCPQTATLLREIPGIETAFFSVLGPGQSINPHFGYYKGFLRYHLGLMIPNDNANGECFIRMNSDRQANRARNKDAIGEGATYYWRNGEGVIFDDTFLHDATNESDEARVVLFVDVRRKMPRLLGWLNAAFLFVAQRDKSVKKIRRNAIAKNQKKQESSEDIQYD